MSTERHRTVYRRSDGLWVNESNDPRQPPMLLRTQREALEEARWMLMTEGGGRLTLVGEERKSRGKDTASPGNDPSPKRNTEVRRKPMGTGRHRTVYRRSDGLWVNESNDPQQSPRILRTQREALEEARWMLMTEGGGRLTLVGEDR